jgi:hypothetical protein
VRVMVVVSFLVVENKRGGDGSLPCVAAHEGRGAVERHKTGHLGVGGRVIKRRRRMVGRARRDGNDTRIGSGDTVRCGRRMGMVGRMGTTK